MPITFEAFKLLFCEVDWIKNKCRNFFIPVELITCKSFTIQMDLLKDSFSTSGSKKHGGEKWTHASPKLANTKWFGTRERESRLLEASCNTAISECSSVITHLLKKINRAALSKNSLLSR